MYLPQKYNLNFLYFSLQDDFNSGRGDKLSQVEEQIEDVKRVMLHNVEKVMDRGEKLDDLLTKTEELESQVNHVPSFNILVCFTFLDNYFLIFQGQDFRRQARAVFVQARCRNLKLWLVIGSMFSVFVTIVILFATGVIKS